MAAIDAKRIRGFLQRYKGSVAHELGQRAKFQVYRLEAVRSAARRLLTPRVPKAWLFIVGCYNSGTTITREIMSAHPVMRIMPREGVRLTSVFPRPEDLGWQRMWVLCPEHMTMPGPDRPDLAARAIAEWTPWWGKGGEVFVEKSISHVTRMEWLDRHFDNAYFLGITRDGYCVADGIRKRARPQGRNVRQFPDGYPLELTARQWVDANERLAESAPRVRRYLGIRYEDLATNPIDTLGRIWDFVGVERPAMDYTGGVLTVAGHEFAIDNRNAEVHARLGAEERRRITPIVADLQRRLGYPVLDA